MKSLKQLAKKSASFISLIFSSSHDRSRQQEELFDGVNFQNSVQQKFLVNINLILEQKYTDRKLRVKDIAEKLAMSERQLQRKVKDTTSLSPIEYLRRFRLDKAKQLLENGKASGFVTYEVGFSSQSYFCKCFKERYSVSPSEVLHREIAPDQMEQKGELEDFRFYVESPQKVA